MTDTARRRPPRRRPGDAGPKQWALVVASSLRSPASGQVFSRRRHVWVDLSCGHRVLRVVHRLFLIGERVRCPECERRRARAALELPFEGHVSC